ncbi:uncharacterized protein LOC126746276 [Anthonomus grandis grandis]|uniref:uncharacterized protein LOC126746276 n=1 Tax=Anthonomus grandis grandis TaxID=2921223 RepID=UPI00216610AA|nr:uncharacterized protein LOC126746276 [Anthonomus grandis grandis]
MFKLKTYFLFLLTFKLSKPEEIFYNVNNLKVLHKVSDKFLSISIDPGVLLAGVNLSDISLTLAKHLGPAHIRLAGPSTSFLKYLDNEDEPKGGNRDGDVLYVTPSMWFGINEWFNLASLTPVFGLNDREVEKGLWSPKGTLPLLELSDKFGVNCYWQLGNDCSNKTAIRYVEELNILRQTLNRFPEHNDTWKIVGSDFSTCASNDISNGEFQQYIRDLDLNVDAVMWQTFLISKQDLGFKEASLWTSIPKEKHPITFKSAMEWALKVGNAATLGYDVVFREPRLFEITHDTPVYWFSFLYKKLMGTNVLDIKTPLGNPNMTAFAHCTKRPNNFVRSGSVTLMMINNRSETCQANVRLNTVILEKSMEVQSYFLTRSNESESKTVLNGEELTLTRLNNPDQILKPKLRRAKLMGYVSLEMPPQTIAFFVLTGAKYGICSQNEDDLDSILEQINNEQFESGSVEDVQFNIEGRMGNIEENNPISLQSIKKNILKEKELDKSFYGNFLRKPQREHDLLEKHLANFKKNALHKHLKTFVEKSKKNDLITRSPLKTPYISNMHLTVKEVEEILKRRARAKALAKNVKLTSAELDMLVNKATLKIPKSLWHTLRKRDINKILLEEKANHYKNNLFSQETLEQHFKQKNKLHPKLKLFKRDINLDLLKRKSEPSPVSLRSRSKTVVQPKETYGRRNNMDQYSEEPLNEDFFEDFLHFEEKLIEDIKDPRRSFADDLKRLDLRKLQQELFKKPKTTTVNPLGKRYFQYLKASHEDYDEDDLDPIVEDYPAPSFSRFNDKRNKDGWRDWQVKAHHTNKDIGERSFLCDDMDTFNYLENMDYGFLRKKRSSDKIQSLLKKMKNRQKLGSTENQKRSKRSLLNNNLNGISPPQLELNLMNPVYWATLPVKTWIQEQKIKNALMQNQLHQTFALRKRRHIEDRSSETRKNEISNEADGKWFKKIEREKWHPEGVAKNEILKEQTGPKANEVSNIYKTPNFQTSLLVKSFQELADDLKDKVDLVKKSVLSFFENCCKNYILF